MTPLSLIEIAPLEIAKLSVVNEATPLLESVASSQLIVTLPVAPLTSIPSPATAVAT